MDKRDAAQKYVDILARAFQMLSSFSDFQLFILKTAEYDLSISEDIKNRIHATKSEDVSVLLQTVQELLDEMMHQPEGRRLSYAVSICLCMDQQICYADDGEDSSSVWKKGRMNLHSLVPIKSGRQPIMVKTLNQNKEETGICIAPKFPVSVALTSTGTETVRRSLASKRALYGINGSLVNVSYYPWKKDTPDVSHIILPERLLSKEKTLLPEETRIVFSPLTDKPDLLNKGAPAVQTVEGISCRTVVVNGVTDPGYIEERFTDNWNSACEMAPDIFFAPEMLATDKMVQIENQGSVFLKPLLKAVAMAGRKAPRLTLLPTYSRDRTNRLLVFDETGRHWGTQFKRVPYVNQRDGLMEALDLPPANDVLMIHMKNQQRIAVVICAEFLSSPGYVNDFLCGQLGATLILVPSYSPGERDFIDSLPALKPFGTSVVWGNCCGAVHGEDEQPPKRIIGACSYAGIDEPARFGSVNRCGFRCDSCKTCLFLVNIPTEVAQDKPDSSRAPSILHVCG